MNGRSEIDDAWNDLLGEDEPESASTPSAPKVAAPTVPQVPRLNPPGAEAPVLDSPPSANPPAAPTVPGVKARAPEVPRFSLPPLGTKRPAPAPKGTDAGPPPSSSPTPSSGAAELPPPPEFTARESSTELPLEAMALHDGPPTDELVPIDLGDSSPVSVASPATGSAAPPATNPAEDEDEDELDVDLDTSASDLPRLSPARTDELDADVGPTSEDELDIDLDTSATSLRAELDPSITDSDPARPVTAFDDDEDDERANESGVSSVEVSNWRATGPVEEVVRARPPTGVSPPVRASARRATPFADAVPAEPGSRAPWPWIAGGLAAVLAVGLLVWSGSRGDEPEAAAAPSVAAKETSSKASAPEDAGPTPADDDGPAADSDGEAEAEPTDAVPLDAGPGDASTDIDAEPEATEADAAEAPTETEPARTAATGPSAEYVAAAARHEATGTQESLLAMVLAACADDDGALARTAMRKLKGKELRSEAIVSCKHANVDVLANVESYTGPEFLRRAQAALDGGDAPTALGLARASNKVERTGKATSLMLRAACAMKDTEEAERMLPHVPKKWRPELIEHCAAQGVTLEP